MEPIRTLAGRSQRGAALLAEEMRAAVAPVRVEAGDIVAHQGEKGRFFYFVGAGALDVVITSEEGLRLPVARLGPGSHFGEMSLLAGMPVSADVVAAEPSSLYGLAPCEFEELIRRKPELVEYLASELAVRLKQTNQQLAAQQQRHAILSNLITSRHSSVFTPALPSFDWKLTAAIAEAAQSDLPLLIVGEKGVGKKTLAFYAHATGARQNRPVLVVDCREVPPEGARSLLFGDAPPDSVYRFADRLGYLQAADRGTLILAHMDRLPPEVQDDLATFIRTHRQQTGDFRVAVRIVGTVAVGPDEVEAPCRLSGALVEAFVQGQTIQLRPLRQRRRDILPLAEHFLRQAAQLSGQSVQQLGDSARQKLLSHDFRFENAEELRQVVNLGLDLADGEVIDAQHLFFGAGIGTDTPQIDVLRSRWVAQLLTGGRALPAAKAAIGAVFAAIIAVCLAAPESVAGRAANVMMWGLWWPGLVLASVFLGRVWCALCPLSSGSEVAQRRGGRGLSPTSGMKAAWPLPALVGFAVILWIEHTTQMTAHPRATAFLLLGLGTIAAAMGWLFQRHTWCRYLCPLGAMSAAFSTASALRLRARREVCQASCTGNECYKGSERAQGCPMFNHALFLNGGEYCKLCLECLRACPVQSPRLILQLPLREIWRSDLLSTEVAPLTVLVGLMALLLAALPPTGSHLAAETWRFTLGTVIALGAGIGAHVWLRLTRQRTGTDSFSWAGRVVYAYAPAVAGVLCGFHLLFLPWLGEVSLRVAGAHQDLWGLSLRLALQSALLGLGGVMTLWALWRLCQRRFGTVVASLAAWAGLSLAATTYLATALVLLARR